MYLKDSHNTHTNIKKNTLVIIIVIFISIVFYNKKETINYEIKAGTSYTNDQQILIEDYAKINTLLTKKEKNILILNNKKLYLEIADTKEKRTLGLSNRDPFVNTENLIKGMLFIFEKESFYGFWMKDMRFAIDIIWINKDKKIVAIDKNINQETYPQVFFPPEPILYVIEVNAFDSEKLNLETGNYLSEIR